MAEWVKAHPRPSATLAEVADHIEHIRKVAGVDHVASAPTSTASATRPWAEGVDKYPALLAELARRGWSDEDLAKVAGGNVLRVMAEAEAVSARLKASRPPSQATIEQLDKPAAK